MLFDERDVCIVIITVQYVNSCVCDGHVTRRKRKPSSAMKSASFRYLIHWFRCLKHCKGQNCLSFAFHVLWIKLVALEQVHMQNKPADHQTCPLRALFFERVVSTGITSSRTLTRKFTFASGSIRLLRYNVTSWKFFPVIAFKASDPIAYLIWQVTLLSPIISDATSCFPRNVNKIETIPKNITVSSLSLVILEGLSLTCCFLYS